MKLETSTFKGSCRFTAGAAPIGRDILDEEDGPLKESGSCCLIFLFHGELLQHFLAGLGRSHLVSRHGFAARSRLRSGLCTRSCSLGHTFTSQRSNLQESFREALTEAAAAYNFGEVHTLRRNNVSCKVAVGHLTASLKPCCTSILWFRSASVAHGVTRHKT